jgi:hypothetical protein
MWRIPTATSSALAAVRRQASKATDPTGLTSTPAREARAASIRPQYCGTTDYTPTKRKEVAMAVCAGLRGLGAGKRGRQGRVASGFATFGRYRYGASGCQAGVGRAVRDGS